MVRGEVVVVDEKNTTTKATSQLIDINKIYSEDCISGMKKIQNETVDIIICDPPYNIGKDFGNESDKQQTDTNRNPLHAVAAFSNKKLLHI